MNPLLETWASVGPDHNHLQKPYWTIEQTNCKCNSGSEPCAITTVGQEMVAGCDKGLTYADLEKRAAIIAAAPRMLRLLLDLEWGQLVDDEECMVCLICDEGCYVDQPEHAEHCEYDALLTELGFPDAASRDAARKLIAELP